MPFNPNINQSYSPTFGGGDASASSPAQSQTSLNNYSQQLGSMGALPSGWATLGGSSGTQGQAMPPIPGQGLSNNGLGSSAAPMGGGSSNFSPTPSNNQGLGSFAAPSLGGSGGGMGSNSYNPGAATVPNYGYTVVPGPAQTGPPLGGPQPGQPNYTPTPPALGGGTGTTPDTSSNTGTTPNSSTSGTPQKVYGPTDFSNANGYYQTPPPGYINVPFGSGFSTDPSLTTFLNQQTAYLNSPMMNPAMQRNELTQAAAGDPMWNQVVPGTNLNWNDLNENQKNAYTWASNAGLPSGVNMQTFLSQNVGQTGSANPYNLSYNQAGITSGGIYTSPGINDGTQYSLTTGGMPNQNPNGGYVAPAPQLGGISKTYGITDNPQITQAPAVPQWGVQTTPLGYTQYTPPPATTNTSLGGGSGNNDLLYSLLAYILSQGSNNTSQNGIGQVLGGTQ